MKFVKPCHSAPSASKRQRAVYAKAAAVEMRQLCPCLLGLAVASMVYLSVQHWRRSSPGPLSLLQRPALTSSAPYHTRTSRPWSALIFLEEETSLE